jgi:glycosyltransferase involved in cell wall biosynthesis
VKMKLNAASQPLVSIVVPAYNEAKHIGECIESLLAQTYQNWECIVANNCSTDGSGEIARQYAAKDSRVRVYDNEQFLRAVPNYNYALTRISPSAKYVKIVFADDWIFPQCLDEMVAVAEEYSSIGIVGAYGLQGRQVMWAGLPYPSRRVSGREICRQLFINGIYVFGSATSLLYRADLVRGGDPFFNESNLHSDMETCIQLLRNYDFGFVHQILSFSREEQPGCLREISEDLHTYMAGNFYNLAVYGPEFLDRREFQLCMKRSLANYYEFLAGAVVRRRNKKFWDYHRKRMNATGVRFSRARIAWTLLAKLCSAVLNPKTMIERGWQIVSEVVSRNQSVVRTTGDVINEQKPI